jgi:hypothetical protein
MVSLMLGFSVPIWAGRRQLEMRRETRAMRLSAEACVLSMFFARLTRGGIMRPENCSKLCLNTF